MGGSNKLKIKVENFKRFHHQNVKRQKFHNESFLCPTSKALKKTSVDEASKAFLCMQKIWYNYL